MRAMFLEFPKDRTCWLVDQQYMLGGHLLVAPVFGESRVEYYLPAGVWTNILTGKEVAGGRWVEESHTMASLPLLLRPGSAIIIGKEGHLVTDSIWQRGYTVVVSQQCREEIKVTSVLRGSREVSVTISPEIKNGKVAAFDISGSDQVEFDVVVIGANKGFNDGSSAVSEMGLCRVGLEG